MTVHNEDFSFRQVLLEINKIIKFGRKLFGLPVPHQLSSAILI